MNRSLIGTKTLSFSSGKGGVGKTSLLVNVAMGLAEKGQKVLIFDGDLGLSNVEIFFNQRPKGHILEVMEGHKELSEVITPLSENLDLISGGHGLIEAVRLNAFSRKSMIDSVTSIERRYDYLLIDTAPGIGDNVLYLNAAAQQIMVVITPDAASVTDSYALIKLLHQIHGEKKFNIICNQVRDENEGLGLFSRFNEVVNRFMCVGLDYAGSIPHDTVYKRSSQSQRLLHKMETKVEALQHLGKLIANIQNQNRSQASLDKGGLQFFWEQVIGVA